jgi:hypothetical protein
MMFEGIMGAAAFKSNVNLRARKKSVAFFNHPPEFCK